LILLNTHVVNMTLKLYLSITKNIINFILTPLTLHLLNMIIGAIFVIQE